MLLLKLPKFGVDIEGTAKIGLPLFVSILREISKVEKRNKSVYHIFINMTCDGHEAVKRVNWEEKVKE